MFPTEETPSARWVEMPPGDICLSSEADALDLVAACGEAGTANLLLDGSNLAPAFFDLKSGLAGAALLKFTNYRVRVAAVLTPEQVGEGRFAEFASETRRSRDFRIFYDRDAAIRWLEEA